jgi:biopolymer transport protein ExbD
MRFTRRLRPRINVDLVPMIDVVFQLVVFFMVSTTFIVTPGIALTFPAAATSEPVAMTRVVVTVVSRDEIYLNKERFDIPALSDKLAELKEAGSTGQGEIQRTIVLEGDREIPYRLLIEVLDVLRKNGYRAVNLKTSKLTGD